MDMFRFRDRASALDDRSRGFLTTVASLGGYVSAEQAQLLGVRNSTARVHNELKDLESAGFIKRIATYPAVYQITKSVTRLIGADLSARREHVAETIRTRLLTVNFYLEAIHWPVEFVFDHQQKISKFCGFGFDPSLLPQRGSKPYLWQDIVLEYPSGNLAVGLVDDCGRSSSRQLSGLIQRFAPSLRFIQNELQLLIVVGSEHRYRLFSRSLKRPRLQRLVPDISLHSAVRFYRVRRATPVVRLFPNSRQLRELWTKHFFVDANRRSAQEPKQVTHNGAIHTNTGVSAEKGDMSW
jgi:hypothetical protein